MPTWPDITEFTDYMIASGLYGLNPTAAQQKLDLQGALDGAVDTWNDLTHYWPFLSDGNAKEERRFDPPWPDVLLDLNSGLVSLTKVQADVTFGNTTPTTLTNIQDFWLRPSDAAPRKKPWTAIWLRRIFSVREPASIAVIGEWGYCNQFTLPAAARDAVMAIAAQGLIPQIQTQLSHGGLIRLQEGDSQKEWGFAELSKTWEGVVKQALAIYTRVRAV